MILPAGWPLMVMSNCNTNGVNVLDSGRMNIDRRDTHEDVGHGG